MADLSNVMLHYVETTEEASKFIDWIKQGHKAVAIDTETTGLERDARIRLIQFGNENVAWTLRWDRYKGTAIEALDLMKAGRQRVAYHNSPYDVPKIEKQSALDAGDGHKTDWGLVDDTMILSRLASPLGSHSLKYLSAKYVDRRAGGMQSILSNAMSSNNWTWETVPYSYEGYTVYAGIDCILTARLLPFLEAMPYSKDLYATEMSTLEACINMSEIGLAVDTEYCTNQISLLEAEIADVVQQGKDRHRFHAFGSDQLVIEKFHDYLEFWEERTEKGRVSLEATILERLTVQADSEAAKDLARLTLAYRTRVKLLNTYFRNMLVGSDADGRVHPDINTLEAVTGRMTVKGQPAMQTLPRGPRVRRGFVASPKHQLILADYAQIEMRLLAHFCQDPALMDAINSSDLHSAVAGMIFGEDNVTPDLRQLAKSSSFAVIYGAGPEKFSHTAGVPVEQGAAFLDAYHDRFPHIKQFTQEVQNVARVREKAGQGAHVVTPAGRKLQMRKSDAHYTLVNYLIQGSAADVFKQAIARLWETDLGPMMRLPVHDECLFEVPIDLDPEEVKREIVKVMEDNSLRVPISVEATGPYNSWADKYDV